MPPLEPGLLSAFMSSAGFWLVYHLADTLPAQTQAHRVCSWEDMTGLSEPRCPMLRCCMTISRLVLSGFLFFFFFFLFLPSPITAMQCCSRHSHPSHSAPGPFQPELHTHCPA